MHLPWLVAALGSCMRMDVWTSLIYSKAIWHPYIYICLFNNMWYHRFLVDYNAPHLQELLQYTQCIASIRPKGLNTIVFHFWSFISASICSLQKHVFCLYILLKDCYFHLALSLSRGHVFDKIEAWNVSLNEAFYKFYFFNFVACCNAFLLR